ncbi:MAG: hypothetical protein JWM37_250 [Candidatus Saccharibacteria bacterium]|nr:hypothetical protein [Candidatus Saccharibacteria bacterium]
MSVRDWYAHENDNRRVNIFITVVVIGLFVVVFWLALMFSGALSSSVRNATGSTGASFPTQTSSAPATTPTTTASSSPTTVTTTQESTTSASASATASSAPPATTQPAATTTAAPAPVTTSSAPPPAAPRTISTFQAVYCGWTDGAGERTVYVSGPPYSMNLAQAMASDSLRPGSGQMSIGAAYQYETVANGYNSGEVIHRITPGSGSGSCDYPQNDG